MNKYKLDEKEIKIIRSILNKPDGVIAFPTDTVWGVGCLVQNKEAVEKIYSVKGRPKNKPLILLGSKIEYLVPYVSHIIPEAQEIMDKYFPGAITIILPKSHKTPDYVTSGFNTVGIRVPNHPVFLDVLENATEEHVLATTSANLSGEPSSSKKSDVEAVLQDSVDYIVDDYGYSACGQASTIVSIDDNGHIKVLREGSIKL